MMDDWVRKRICVSGRVQGVGFRYFVKKQARQYGLVGYVRNLPNGDVEIEAAGNVTDFIRFISVIKKGSSASRVDNVSEQQIPLENLPNEFDIQYY